MKNILNGQGKLFYAKLTKAERIKSRSLLLYVIKYGQKYKCTSFGIIYLFVDSSSFSHQKFKTQFSIAVPKKVTKKSSERNRIKRIYRHAWQLIKKNWEDTIPNTLKLCFLITVYNYSVNQLDVVVNELQIAFQKILLNLPHAEY